MESVKNFLPLLQRFGVDPSWVREESIYPFAPVFLCEHPKQKLILKRTRTPFAKAEALFAWTRHLAKNEVLVVTPTDVLPLNPVNYGEQIWVAYPYIEGEVYRGEMDQIQAAGDLLGRIHSGDFIPCNEFSCYAWEVQSQESIDEDLSGLERVMFQNEIEDSRAMLERYKSSLNDLPLKVGPLLALPESDLPWCCASWDFKANNLIYRGGSPVLIDPDNAGYLPRIFDLALAVILFHNEHAGAPGRLFNVEEWHAFLDGYARHISLTEIEKKNWQNTLEFMRLEEGLWLMTNDDDGWQKLAQGDFLRSLLTTDLVCFGLE